MWGLAEPRGDVLTSLLQFAAKQRAASFCFVVPEDDEDGKPWLSADASVRPWLSGAPRLTKSWPGTQSGVRSRLCSMRLVPETALVVRRMADDLFLWRYPSLPDDPAIIVADVEWLVSATHERRCWHRGTRASLELLLRNVSGLSVLQGQGIGARKFAVAAGESAEGWK